MLLRSPPYGEHDRERCPPVGTVLCPDTASVLFDETFRNGKPQTRALCLRGKERLEDPVDDGPVDPLAGIRYRYAERLRGFFVSGLYGDHNAPPSGGPRAGGEGGWSYYFLGWR